MRVVHQIQRQCRLKAGTWPDREKILAQCARCRPSDSTSRPHLVFSLAGTCKASTSPCTHPLIGSPWPRLASFWAWPCGQQGGTSTWTLTISYARSGSQGRRGTRSPMAAPSTLCLAPISSARSLSGLASQWLDGVSPRSPSPHSQR